MTPDAAPTALQDLPPESTFGPYRIVRLLGRGGMGAVYEAEHHADGRIVALKLLSVDLDKMDARARFLREGQIAAAINHPNAVYIYGTEEIEGTPAITMELVPGGTLDDKVKDRGAIPWSEAVEDIVQVIDGLDAALAAGVLHRDVKPSNCFVGTAGLVKIGDFGLSKPIDSDEQQKLTKTGLFLGTPVFSSPEQLLGESLDLRSDIYAVGVTFYYLLSGQLPYHSGSMMQVVAAVLNGAPAPLTRFQSDVPQPVVDVVMKSMARKADDRYQTYAEFRAAVAGLRVTEVAPATLWDRFRAAFVDWAINTSLVWIVTWTLLRGMVATLSAGNSRSTNWQQIVASFVIALLVVAVPEGLRGASVGKWIVGLRVIGPDGQPPGIPRAAMRVLLLFTSDALNLIVLRFVTNPNKLAAAVLLTTVLTRSVFLVTARRNNGWRLLHDVLTGTRVVRPRATTVVRRGEAQRLAAPTLSGREARIGPYVVLGPVRSGGDIVHGWDDAMRRAVWIVPRQDDATELSPARRTLSRLTRLRWVGGRRTANDSWDAFEAPIGETFQERLRRPVPWHVRQDWLQDVSNELIAADADGTTIAASADALWVTPTDRLVFPEIDPSEAGNPSAFNREPITVVSELLDRIRDASTIDAPLPRHASRAIAAARSAKSANDVLSLVRGTLGRPTTVTRMRRGGLVAASVAPIVAMSFAGAFSVNQAMKLDQSGFKMQGLLSFITDSMLTRDSVVKKARADSASGDASRRFGLAMQSLGVFPANDVDTITPIATLRRQRHLAEVYLSTALAARARDTTAKSMFGNTPKDQRRRILILGRNQQIDSGTAREARQLVDSVWKGVVPSNGPEVFLRVVPLFTVALFLIMGAFISTVAGLFARRGPMMRGFQLDIVTADGEAASRWRIFVRNLAIWFVVPIGWLVFVLAPHIAVRMYPALLVAAAVISVIALVLGIASSLHTPSRGLTERVSGTYLVPE